MTNRFQSNWRGLLLFGFVIIVFFVFLNELNRNYGTGIVNMICYVSIGVMLYNVYFLMYGQFENLCEITKEYYYGYETRPANFWRRFRRLFYDYVYEPELDQVGRRIVIGTLTPALIAIVVCCWFKVSPVYLTYLEQPELIFKTLTFGLMGLFSLGIVSATGKWA